MCFRSYILLFLAFSAFTGCHDGEKEHPVSTITVPKVPTGRIVITGKNEPGERMILFIQLNDEAGYPLPKVPIRYYQSDKDGNWNESVPGDLTTARLSGTCITD